MRRHDAANWVALATLTAVTAFVVGWQCVPVRPLVICGTSMQPTLRNGQWCVLDRRLSPVKPICRGEIVCFRVQGETCVKRVYALGGDSVWTLASDLAPATVPAPADLPRLQRLLERFPAAGRLVRIDVPPGMLYVLGDGAAVSRDSRDFGPVPCTAVIGRVLPFKNAAPAVLPNPASVLTSSASRS